MELTEKMSLFLGSQFRYNAVRLGTCDQGPDAGRFEIIREIAMVLSPMCRRGFFIPAHSKMPIFHLSPIPW